MTTHEHFPIIMFCHCRLAVDRGGLYTAIASVYHILVSEILIIKYLYREERRRGRGRGRRGRKRRRRRKLRKEKKGNKASIYFKLK